MTDELLKPFNKVFDVTKLYNEPLKNILNSFVETSKIIFEGIKEILNTNYENYLKINMN